MGPILAGWPLEDRWLGLIGTGALALAVEVFTVLETLTTVWAAGTGAATLMVLEPAELALTWLAGVVCAELALHRAAAGSVLTWFTCTEDFWGRLGGFEAGLGDGIL